MSGEWTWTALRLVTGETVQVQIGAKDWADMFSTAMKRNLIIEVRASDGRVLAVNPRAIAYSQTDPPSTGSGGPEGERDSDV